ncbi:MAG: hypothetical protein K0V04_05860 [Deltaproteobacteria bacterium]|nr:hypothetical protein [Deltaproteobacteria bacterium]
MKSQRQLMRCLPHPAPETRPSELRITFDPLPDPPRGLGPRLIASRVERAGIDPADDESIPIPSEARRCLDGLLGSELELPEGSPQLETGHEMFIFAAI